MLRLRLGGGGSVLAATPDSAHSSKVEFSEPHHHIRMPPRPSAWLRLRYRLTFTLNLSLTLSLSLPLRLRRSTACCCNRCCPLHSLLRTYTYILGPSHSMFSAQAQDRSRCIVGASLSPRRIRAAICCAAMMPYPRRLGSGLGLGGLGLGGLGLGLGFDLHCWIWC